MELFVISLVGYLIGSIPFANRMESYFHKRGCEKPPLEAVIFASSLDTMKVTFVTYLAVQAGGHFWAVGCAGLAAALGHCYPLFARFRGGRGVCAFFGFLLALWVFADQSAAVLFFPLLVFWLLLFTTGKAAVAGFFAAWEALICIWANGGPPSCIFAAAMFSFLISFRYRDSLHRQSADAGYSVILR